MTEANPQGGSSIVFEREQDAAFFSRRYGAYEAKDQIEKMLQEPGIQEQMQNNNIVLFRTDNGSSSVVATDFLGREISRGGNVSYHPQLDFTVVAKPSSKMGKYLFHPEEMLLSKDGQAEMNRLRGDDKIVLSLPDESREKLSLLYQNRQVEDMPRKIRMNMKRANPASWPGRITEFVSVTKDWVSGLAQER